MSMFFWLLFECISGSIGLVVGSRLVVVIV